MTNRIYPKPILYISKCITFAPVRWNGSIVSSDLVDKLVKYITPVTHCPEMEIGMGVPREPVRIVAFDKAMKDLHLIQPSTGRDFTDKMIDYVEKTLNGLPEVDGFILKAKSPSSAFRDAKIYPNLPDGKKGSPLTGKAPGFFGRGVLEKFPQLPVEDESRLNDSAIRDSFLKKIFVIADFRQVKKKNKPAELVKFQERNKLLFMSFNQKLMREAGKIAANNAKEPFVKVMEAYENKLYELLRSQHKISNVINTFEHAFGYFKDGLSGREKKYFLSVLAKYKNGKAPFSLPAGLIGSYIERFDVKYLAGQTFFDPYPEDLA